jgi:hypothetical protein
MPWVGRVTVIEKKKYHTPTELGEVNYGKENRRYRTIST